MAEPQQSRRTAAASQGGPDPLAELRRRIDEVDTAILEQLNERARLAQEVGQLKQIHGTPVYAASREREIVDRLKGLNGGPFPSAGLAPVFREIISATRSLEEVLRVAFLGPEGTFSHVAAGRRFGELADLAGVATIGDVFAAVERGASDLGVVPVENTTEGVVTQSLDALAQSQLEITGEIVLRISLSLFSRSGLLGDVRRVASHPQPLAQCRGWLDRHLPQVERVETASTAAAAQLAAGDPDVAAIGSEMGARVYGLETIEPSIEDRRDNTTRFVVIGGEPPPPSDNDLTSVVFTTRRDESGALYRLLQPFAERGVNLTSIQQRPIAGKPWEYLFFIDLEGHRDEERVQEALGAAARIAHSHRVLGSFPRATGERPPRGADEG